MQFVGTFWALVPPIIAITLALITKEAYSSLFIGVVIGALFACDFAPRRHDRHDRQRWHHRRDRGQRGHLSLPRPARHHRGACQLSRRQRGLWPLGGKKNIHTRVGAQLATFILGILIFIDDYFNCLTVGSVMRPVTDRHQILVPSSPTSSTPLPLPCA